MNKVFVLVDDDVDDIQLFCDALESVDNTIICHCAPNGAEAIDLLGRVASPDIIFLDVNMPGMDGWQCLKKIKASEAHHHIPVLMYSTSQREADVNTALDTGALCFFTKPNNFGDLKNILAVIAANLHGDLLSAISHFNNIKSKKVFACTDNGE
jgi:CheY-like chemotaxis protein